MLANNIDINEALIHTKELSKQKPESEPKFSSYSPIWLAPTSNVKRVSTLYSNRESALVEGGMGAISYELALNGTKKIDCFDINILQYFYFALYNAALRHMSYKDFISNFTVKRSGMVQEFTNTFLSTDLFDILEYVEEPALKYWCEVLKKYDMLKLINSNFARGDYAYFLEYLSKFSSVYNKKDFYKLQELLNSNELEINYHICDIVDLDKEFERKKYDLVIFDNILQYYKDIKGINDCHDIKKIFDNKWKPLLNNGGLMELCYGYQTTADALKKLKNPDHQVINKEQLDKLCKKVGLDSFDDPRFVYMYNKMISYGLDVDIDNGFICNYVKNYNDCDITFIPGVEFEELDNVEDVVLTYHKNN